SPRLVVQRILRAVPHIGDEARHDGLVYIDHLHQIFPRVRIELATAPLVIRRAESCFEEQLAGPRRGPTRRLDTLRAELTVAVRFRRRGEDEDRGAAQRGRAGAGAAHWLFIPGERNLVALRG